MTLHHGIFKSKKRRTLLDEAIERLVVALRQHGNHNSKSRKRTESIANRTKQQDYDNAFVDMMTLFTIHESIRRDKELLVLLKAIFILEKSWYQDSYSKQDLQCKRNAYFPYTRKRARSRVYEWDCLKVFQLALESVEDWQADLTNDCLQTDMLYSCPLLDNPMTFTPNYPLPDLQQEVDDMKKRHPKRLVFNRKWFRWSAHNQIINIFVALKKFNVSENDLKEVHVYAVRRTNIKNMSALFALIHLFEKYDLHVNEKQLVALLLKAFSLNLAYWRLEKRRLARINDPYAKSKANSYLEDTKWGWNRVMHWHVLLCADKRRCQEEEQQVRIDLGIPNPNEAF